MMKGTGDLFPKKCMEHPLRFALDATHCNFCSRKHDPTRVREILTVGLERDCVGGGLARVKGLIEPSLDHLGAISVSMRRLVIPYTRLALLEAKEIDFMGPNPDRIPRCMECMECGRPRQIVRPSGCGV